MAVAILLPILMAAGFIAARPSSSTPAVAEAVAGSNDGVCSGLDSGKIDVNDPSSVTVTAPDGFLIDGYCVKAGSQHNGFGPVTCPGSSGCAPLPAKTVTITYPGKDSISHYSVSYMPDNTTTTAPPTTEGPTTTVAPTTAPPTTAPATTVPGATTTLPGATTTVPPTTPPAPPTTAPPAGPPVLPPTR